MTGTRIAGATAVVTGGQRGLGSAIADELLRRGAAKVYATSRQPSEAAGGARIVRVATDVTSDDSVADLAEIARDATIVVNNAGLLGGQSLIRDSAAEIRSVMETNYFGPVRIARAFTPILSNRPNSTLVNIASVLSWLPSAGAYGCSKAALWSATNSMRLELADLGINVIGIYLGYTDTGMVADLDVPKNSPADVARQIADGIEAGAAEVIADDFTRLARASVFA